MCPDGRPVEEVLSLAVLFGPDDARDAVAGSGFDIPRAGRKLEVGAELGMGMKIPDDDRIVESESADDAGRAGLDMGQSLRQTGARLHLDIGDQLLQPGMQVEGCDEQVLDLPYII